MIWTTLLVIAVFVFIIALYKIIMNIIKIRSAINDRPIKEIINGINLETSFTKDFIIKTCSKMSRLWLMFISIALSYIIWYCN